MTEIIARGGEVVIVDDDFTPPGPLSVNAEGYVRVYHPEEGGFQAKVTRNYKVHHLGTYATPEEAASAVSKFKEVHDEDLVQVGP